jgi:hypothetical protein
MQTYADLNERRLRLLRSVDLSATRTRHATRNDLNLAEFCLGQALKQRAAPDHESIELRNAAMHLDTVEAILREAELC